MGVDVRIAGVGPTIRCMEQPVGDADASAPSLTVAAVARRLGVAPATLRTWDRRYGVGPSSHPAGAHRRYTPADVRRLEEMRRLTLNGVAPSEAARIALSGDHGSPLAPDLPGPAETVVPPRTTEAAVRGLTRAARALDARAIDTMLAEALRTHGVLWTWDALLVPVLTRLGDRWEESSKGVDVEHLMAECTLAALRSVAVDAPTPRNARPVILASAPDELHTLPLHALAAALAELAIDARLLGARVPGEALAAAVRRGGASAVFIWAHRIDLADLEQLRAIPAMRPAVQVVVGGPGWSGVPVPGVRRVESFREAVSVLQRAAGG